MLGRSASAVFGVFAALLATGATAQDATTRFTRDDREMNAAVAEARRTLPRFFDSYRSGRTERHSGQGRDPLSVTGSRAHLDERLIPRSMATSWPA
jgi:hypothetical protein